MLSELVANFVAVEIMSHAFYNRQWKQAIEALSAQINREDPLPEVDDNGVPIQVREREGGLGMVMLLEDEIEGRK